MSSIKALVVDYGGVLTGSVKATFEAWLDLDQVEPESFAAVLDEWRVEPDNPMARLETGAITGDEFATLISARLRRVDGAPVPPAGLLDRMFAGMLLDHNALVMLQAARSAGLGTALLSNSWDNDYPWVELDPLLDVRVVSGEVGLRKPDPEIYRLTAQKLGVEPAECVFVDDLPWNIEAAEQVGMVAVLHTALSSTLTALVGHVPELAAYLPSTSQGD